MNYYERYCGDYAKKTARLTLIQHGAYTLLLDEYYSTEQPLPADIDELFRVCRAMTKPEQEAVRFVADRFFPVLDDGLRHNERADEMIEKARPKMEAARANGAKGGRPRKNPVGSGNGNPAETQEKPSGKPSGFSNGNPTETQDETTRARSPAPAPTPSIKTVGTTGGSSHAQGIGTGEFLTPAAISVSLIGWERDRHKAARGISASNIQVIELAELSVTPGELRRAYDAAVADRLATEDPNPVNAGFVKVFIDKARNPPKPRPKADDWHRTPEGVLRKSREIGFGDGRPGETSDQLKARIFDELGRRERQGAAA